MSSHADQVDTGLRTLSMTVLMTPDMTNFRGNVHGGILLKLLDQVAYTCASRYARCVCGDAFSRRRRVSRACARRRTRHVSGQCELHGSHFNGSRHSRIHGRFCRRVCRHTNSCYFTMVAVDDGGHPIPVPSFAPPNI